MSQYLPAGVTDAHPIFNPPGDSVVTVTCESEECVVVPAYSVKARLNELNEFVESLQDLSANTAAMNIPNLLHKIASFREEVEALEDQGSWNCTFEGELELPQEADVEFDCPICGEARHTDNIPERDEDDDRDR
ncbi:hypothetical protein SEA_DANIELLEIGNACE_56 [Arthrobacter phage DanielleIgnace]|nr:hypothetical protein SEA_DANIELLEIGNACE_56 [Arthrobacter phage DanielleIgnace]